MISARKISHQSILDEFHSNLGHGHDSLAPFFSVTLEFSAREPFGDMLKHRERVDKERTVVSSQRLGKGGLFGKQHEGIILSFGLDTITDGENSTARGAVVATRQLEKGYSESIQRANTDCLICLFMSLGFSKS